MKKMLVVCLAMAMLVGVSALTSADDFPSETVGITVSVLPYASLDVEKTALSVSLNQPGAQAEDYTSFTVNTNTDVVVYVDEWSPDLVGDNAGTREQDTNTFQSALLWSVQLFDANGWTNDIAYDNTNFPYLTAANVDAGCSESLRLRLAGHWADDREEAWWNVIADDYTADVNLIVAAR